MIQFRDFRLDFSEKIRRRRLELFNIVFAQIVTEQHVVQRKLFVTREALPRVALLLPAHTIGEIHQIQEGLFDRRSVLLAVVALDNLTVSFVVIDALRIGKHHFV